MNSDIGTMFIYDDFDYCNLIVIITNSSNLQFNIGQRTERYDHGYSQLLEIGLIEI